MKEEFVKEEGPHGSVVEHSLGKGEDAGSIPAVGARMVM